MIIDCHYHLRREILPIDQLLAQMEAEGVDQIALIAEDMGSHLPPISPKFEAIGRFILTHRIFNGLSPKMYSRFTPDGDYTTPRGVLKIIQDPDNEPVFSAIINYPKKFLGWIYVNPNGQNDLMQEFNKWVDSPGVVGVKAHPFNHRFPPIDLLPVAEQISALGKPMLLHLGFGSHGDYRALLKAVPELKLILAHAGFPKYAKFWKDIKSLPNVFVDLSQTSIVDEKITRDVVKYLGVDRCLFGTDGPFGSKGQNGQFDLGCIKRRIIKLFPDKSDQEKLMGENFLKLINL